MSISSTHPQPRDGRVYQIGNIGLFAYDQVDSMAAQWVAWELERNEYGLDSMHFVDGDVVIDVGAHVGLVSMLLAKRWPKLRIIAFEPFPENHRNCRENLRMNSVTNVELHPHGITADRRLLTMSVPDDNSGGATAIPTSRNEPRIEGIPSVTLDDVFNTFHIERCALLKIDCEGMEYEILSQTRCLDRVERLVGEFHSSASIARQGWSPDRLTAHCVRFIDPGDMVVQTNTIEN